MVFVQPNGKPGRMPSYVSGVAAACFFGLALAFGGSRLIGADFAVTFLRSK
jgi:hypothetical protein